MNVCVWMQAYVYVNRHVYGCVYVYVRAYMCFDWLILLHCLVIGSVAGGGRGRCDSVTCDCSAI